MTVPLLGYLMVVTSYPRIARKSREFRSKFQVFCLTFSSRNALNLGNRTARITIVIHANERHILFRSQFWDCSDYLPSGVYFRGIKSMSWEFISISTSRNPSCALLWVELTSWICAGYSFITRKTKNRISCELPVFCRWQFCAKNQKNNGGKEDEWTQGNSL